MRFLLGSFVTVCAFLFVGGSALAEQIYSLGFPPNEGTFNVVGGKPCLLRKGERGSPGNAIDIESDVRLIHFMSKQPLTYPLNGDNPIITLGNGEGFSDKWELSKIPEGRRGVPLKAAEGKFKGWCLDWSETEVEVVVGDDTFHIRHLILVKEPRSPRKFTKYPVSK